MSTRKEESSAGDFGASVVGVSIAAKGPFLIIGVVFSKT